MHSAYKAHKRDSKLLLNNDCPLTFKMIEFYLQFLLSAYRFTIIHRKNTANILEVLPSILLKLNTWHKLSLKNKFKTICTTLIDCFKEVFDYELNFRHIFDLCFIECNKITF